MRSSALLAASLLYATAIVTTPAALAVAVAAPPEPAPRSDLPLTPDQVIASLNQTLAWYREARVALQATDAIFAPQDEQTMLGVLQRAFDTARAEAAVLALAKPSAAGPELPHEDRAMKRANANAAIQADQRQIEDLRKRLRIARARQRPAIRNELATARDRLELDRARVDFLTKLEQFDATSPSIDADLAHRIETLRGSIPELRSPTTAPLARVAPQSPTAPETTRTRGLIRRLIALQHTRTTVDDLAQSTSALERTVNRELSAVRATVRPMLDRLRDLSTNPAGAGSLADEQRTFDDLLARTKLLAAVIVPAREESALLHRFGGDLDAWTEAIDRSVKQALQSLAIGLIGVVIAMAAILVGSVAWRVAAGRYVRDPYRRRLVLIARNVVVLTALILVLVLHFASELTVLVTGLGFAAAGIAFAMQNVILAMAGYFSMVAPNGIRVGDRVSLQGPFGYVRGEVVDIGLVRIRLQELEGNPPRPTGRTVVFPNSVVFTGSFFKDAASEAGTEQVREVEPGAAA